jgi:hypothetical protein
MRRDRHIHVVFGLQEVSRAWRQRHRWVRRCRDDYATGSKRAWKKRSSSGS